MPMPVDGFPMPVDGPVGQLLRRTKEGDQQARKQLFALLADEDQFGAVILAMTRRLFPRSHRARRWVDTRDIVQSALRTGLRNFSDFRGETEGELCGWFRKIIRTKVDRVVRRKEYKLDLNDVEHARKDKHCGTTRLPLSLVLDQELVEALRAAIARLPVDQRLVVELRLRSVSTSQIGCLLGLRQATVRKRESRAVKRLKAMVESPETHPSSDT